ncbi:MAG: TonB-dependent receptor [Aureispira sp.]
MNNVPLRYLLGCIFLFYLPFLSTAQQRSVLKNQIIRGYVTDRSTGKGLANAYIKLLNYHPTISTISDRDGYFELKEVPVGNQRLHIDLEQYYEGIHSQLVVAGKQAVITIALEEEVRMAVVTVRDDRINKKVNDYKNTKLETVDEMNTVSARPVNMEEVGRYISGFNDPVRSIANFPGLFNADDSQNDLISRGNSSYGIQFLIEGVPIENPHHFAQLGRTGGVFPLLNTNALANSDFANGALSAQYGNVYSGVYDANLRKGNNRRHEFMVQISLLGAELSAEGPFKKGKGSYVVNVRGSVFDMLQDLQIEVGTNAIPQYADLNFKIHLPTERAGTFSVFGVGGLSSVSFLNAEIDPNDLFAVQGQDIYVRTNTGLIGANHLYYFDNHTSLKTTLSYLHQDHYNIQDTILKDGSRRAQVEEVWIYQRIGAATTFNRKISSRFVVRAGVQGYLYFYNIKDQGFFPNVLRTYAQEPQIQANAYVQAQYKFSKIWSMTLGLQSMYWSLSADKWSIDPRLSLTCKPHPQHKFSLGYGLHSRTIAPSLSFYVEPELDGSYNNSNRALNALRSHHGVLSYDWSLSKYWSVKANVYFQYQDNVPVEQTPSSFSVLNNGPNETSLLYTNLENTGEGYNYGAELSLEKFFGKGYYGLLSGSYQRSFYRGSDQVWRSSAFDVFYIASFSAGKEFKIGPKRRNIFYADIRVNTHGGLPYIPVDLANSRAEGRTVLDMDNAFTKRVIDYKRIDLRIGLRLNHRKKRISHHVYVEVLNVPQFRNESGEIYLAREERVIRTNQFGFFPNLMYQVRF